MSKSVGIALSLLCIWIGCAHAQEQPIAFPQVGNSPGVYALAFSPDSSLLASGSESGAIRLWDTGSGREIRTLSSHTNGINSLLFLDDGKVLASASNDHSIRLWSIPSAQLLRTLHADNSVLSLAAAPDGVTFVAGDYARFITLWNTSRDDPLEKWRIATAVGGGSVAYLANGRFVALATENGEVDVHDPASGNDFLTLNTCEEKNPSNCKSVGATFSRDGELIAISTRNRTIEIWDAQHARKLREFPTGAALIVSLAMSPDNSTLVTAADDGNLVFWNVTNGRAVYAPSGFKSSPSAKLLYSADGKLLAVGGRGEITVFDVVKRAALYTLTAQATKVAGSNGLFDALAFSPDSRQLAASTGDGTIRLWRARNGRELHQLSGLALPVGTTELSPDGTTIASPSWDGTIKLWDAATGRLSQIQAGRGHPVTSVAFSHDGKILASVTRDNAQPLLWDSTTGRQLSSFIDPMIPSSPSDFLKFQRDEFMNILADQHFSEANCQTSGYSCSARPSSVAFSDDDKLIASVSDGILKLWTRAGQKLWQLNAPCGPGIWPCGAHIAFSPDASVLAWSNWRETSLIDTVSGKAIHTIPIPEGALAFSPDGSILAVSSGYNVHLWDVATWREIRELRAPPATIRSLGFSHDGRKFALGTDDGLIQLWNVSTWSPATRLPGHIGDVRSLSFSRDDNELVSAGEDGTVRLWDLATSRERVSLIGFADGSSIAITPEGYFDSSSAAAEQNINVRIGKRVFGIGSFREQFYRPDLVKASIAGERLEKFGSLGDMKLPPYVDVDDLPASTTAPKIRLNVHLVSDGGGVGTVRLFLNGAAIGDDDSAPLGEGKSTRSYDVPLVNGENRISAVAFNADGTVQSNDATTYVTANLPPAKPVLHAIIVGIQDFRNPAYHLTQPVGDATLFKTALETHMPPGLGAPDIRLLVTPTETDKTHLVAAIKAMQPHVGPNDAFVFYFASHGEVSHGKYYLITSNVGTMDNLAVDALSSRELAGLLAGIPATRKLVVIDACHSQKLGDAMALALADQGMNAGAASTIISRGTGLTSLSAAATDEEALEGDKETEGHGLFTYVLVNALTGKPGTASKPATAKDGTVDTYSLADYVDTEVPLLAKALHSLTPQNPTVAKSGAPFAIALVK